jgi:hypothetical protein
VRKLVLFLATALVFAGVGVSSAAADTASTDTRATNTASASGCTKLVYKFEKRAPVYTYLSGSQEVLFYANKGYIFVYTKGDPADNGTYYGDVYTSSWVYAGTGWVWKGHLDYSYCK